MRSFYYLPALLLLAVGLLFAQNQNGPPQCQEVFELPQGAAQNQGMGTQFDPYVITSPTDPILDLWGPSAYIDELGVIQPEAEFEPGNCANFYIQIMESALPDPPILDDEGTLDAAEFEPDAVGQEVFMTVVYDDPAKKPAGYSGWPQAKKDAYDEARERAREAGLTGGILVFGLMDPGLCKRHAADCLLSSCRACEYQIRPGRWSGSPWMPGRNWHPPVMGHKITAKISAPNDCCIFEVVVNFAGGDSDDRPQISGEYFGGGTGLGSGRSAGSWRGEEGESGTYRLIVMPDCGQEIRLTFKFDGCTLGPQKVQCKTTPCTGDGEGAG